MTNEKIFAAFAVSIARVDGKIVESEVERIVKVASANELDSTAVLEACVKEKENPSNLVELAKEMTEEQKDLALFATIRISLADGVIAAKEIARVHAFCELFGWAPAYTTFKYVQQLKQDPSLKVEGVDC